jgi:lipopolysaccharide/colanic/teichoic acid biosynthesis glycosyltransferase
VTAKRAIDVLLSLAALLVAAPVLGVAMLLIWSGDGHSPFYRARRVGRGARDFSMLKLRSMTIDADRSGGPSTTLSDTRLTPIGRRLRRWKIDELPQFWNVLIGQMSVVGPRPNTRRGGVERYTGEEMRLLAVRPGITDLASIIFSDEAEILEAAADPDARYDAVIRPWKSRLGLLYVDRRNLGDDLRIIGLTATALVDREAGLDGVERMLIRWGADERLRRICRRQGPLPEAHPPGIAA